MPTNIELLVHILDGSADRSSHRVSVIIITKAEHDGYTDVNDVVIYGY